MESYTLIPGDYVNSTCSIKISWGWKNDRRVAWRDYPWVSAALLMNIPKTVNYRQQSLKVRFLKWPYS